jgi:hypothetical protein
MRTPSDRNPLNPLSRRPRLFSLLASAVAVFAVAACTDEVTPDDATGGTMAGGSTSTGGSGGTGVTAGQGGTTSTGGTAGGTTGGGAGVAGTATTGGSGGMAGSASSAGGTSGGSAGSAGTAGTPAAGAGGASGSPPMGGAAGTAGTGGGAAGGVSGSGGAAAGMAGSGAGSGGSSGECVKGVVQPAEVLWIGDSWIEIPGTQHTSVRDLARAAGALGPNENYAKSSQSGTPINGIINQYNSYQSGATKVKVLLMDGGGIDVMQGGKTEGSVNGVVDAFEGHLAKVASDGTVEHIIYFLYSQLPASGPGRDVGPLLEPGMRAACAASTVPCYFIYAEELFAGHPEYVGGDALHPSNSGGEVIGNAIWEIMVENCIAQ